MFWASFHTYSMRLQTSHVNRITPKKTLSTEKSRNERLFSRISAQETLTRTQQIDIARLTNESVSLKHDVASLQNRVYVLENKLIAIRHESTLWNLLLILQFLVSIFKILRSYFVLVRLSYIDVGHLVSVVTQWRIPANSLDNSLYNDLDLIYFKYRNCGIQFHCVLVISQFLKHSF